jgi:hypothetical protein
LRAENTVAGVSLKAIIQKAVFGINSWSTADSLLGLPPGTFKKLCHQGIKLTAKEAADANTVLDIRAGDAVLGPAIDRLVAALSINRSLASKVSKGIAGSFGFTLEPVDAIAPAFRDVGLSAHARLFGDSWDAANAELSADGEDDSGGP